MTTEPWPDKADWDCRQEIHEQRRADDPEHDLSSCWCCCVACEDEE